MQALAKPAYPQLNLGHPLSRGLTYAWNLFEGAGGKIYDSVTGLNTGTINNGAPWVGSPYGSALSFNGSNQWVQTQKNSGVSSLTPFSIVFLVYWPSTPAGTQEVLNARSGVGASPGVFCQVNNSNQLNFGCYDGASFPSLVSGSLSAGNWHHVVGTWSGATGTQTDAALYIDGVSYTTVLGTGFASLVASYPWNIAWEGTGGVFAGSVALFLVYNRTLSFAEAQQLYFDPFVVFRPRSRWWEVLATAAVTPNWGYENEPTFPERRRAQRMLLQDEPIWPRTVVATPTQFGWNNPEQFAKRQIVRGLSRQDIDITTIPIAPTVIQSGWDNPEQFAKRQIVRSVSRQDVDTIVVSTTPTTQVGWDNPEKFAIRSRRGTFQNQDDQFQFTAVPTPAQLSFPWEPQFPVRRKIDALQSPDDEFLLITAAQTPTQQGFAWEPQFPVRKRFTTFQSPDDEFKFTAVATPTQFGWYIDPQFAERRKHRFLINPTDDEWLFTAIKTPTQLGWHTDPQFARRLRLLLKLWEEEGDGPFKPPAGAVANVQHLLMLLGFGR